eukprot:PhM_4_TR2087/c1_g2_i1/m.91459
MMMRTAVLRCVPGVRNLGSLGVGGKLFENQMVAGSQALDSNYYSLDLKYLSNDLVAKNQEHGCPNSVQQVMTMCASTQAPGNIFECLKHALEDTKLKRQKLTKKIEKVNDWKALFRSAEADLALVERPTAVPESMSS